MYEHGYLFENIFIKLKDIEFDAQILLKFQCGIAMIPTDLHDECVRKFFRSLPTEEIRAYEEPTVDTVVFHILNWQKSIDKYHFRFPSSNMKQQFIDMFRIVR